MQVEYEDSGPYPAGPSQPAVHVVAQDGYQRQDDHEDEDDDAAEAALGHTGAGDSDAENGAGGDEDGEGVEADEADEEEEEVEDVEDGANKSGTTTKRVIKQRQSLAEKTPGTTIFPMSRIKRIIKADKDLDMMTSEASFMVAVATEYFIQHFVEESYTKARLEKRKIVNYRDMASLVARSSEFDFLRDVVPEPMPMSEALARRKEKMAMDEHPDMDEDDAQLGQETSETLPPLVPSTNPLFPNAVVKKGSNTHPKTAMPKPSSTPKQPAPPVTPKAFTGKNAPTTPHGLSTRGSARRSLAHADVPQDEDMGEATNGEATNGEAPGADLDHDQVIVVSDRMDED